MSWLHARGGRKPELAPEHRRILSAYAALPAHDPRTHIRATRFVVVDVETTGLDHRRDLLLAVGCTAVDAMLIPFDASFASFVRQETASVSANILVHGIDGTTQTNAPAARDALAAFIQFIGKAPLIAFHARFDRSVLDRALRAHLGVELNNQWLDLARLAPAVMPAHADTRSLDDWTALCGIHIYRRHDALSDALATAQLLQVVLSRAIAQGDTTFADLVDQCKAHQWLGQ